MNRPGAGGEFFVQQLRCLFKPVLLLAERVLQFAWRLSTEGSMYGSVSSFLFRQQLQPTKHRTQAIPVSAEPT